MAFQDFYESYVTCALWLSNDWADESEGDPLDKNYSASDLDPASDTRMQAGACRFYEAHRALWEGEIDDDQAGHDFWLTRNRHGAGFWDRGLTHGDQLTELCESWGECDLYVGDDNRLHFSGHAIGEREISDKHVGMTALRYGLTREEARKLLEHEHDHKLMSEHGMFCYDNACARNSPLARGKMLELLGVERS